LQGLKNFIISEEVKVSHAERYLGFLDRYHSQVFLDLKDHLEKSWRSTIQALSKKHPVSDEAIQDALLRNPKATPELLLTSTGEKLVTARVREPLEVSPSAKVPFVYSVQERHMLTKHILDDAKSSMEAVANRWREVFNYEHKGKLQPWFKILHDPDEVRFQLAMGNGPNESFKTLYSVRVEYGKTGSKLKDYDRIYLFSHLT
jgi:hypothetical protein